MFVALFFQWKNVHENESYVLEWQQTLHWIIPTVHQSQTKGRRIRRPNFWTSACLKKKMSRGRTAEEKPRWRPKWTKTLQNMHNAISDTVVKKKKHFKYSQMEPKMSRKESNRQGRTSWAFKAVWMRQYNSAHSPLLLNCCLFKEVSMHPLS